MKNNELSDKGEYPCSKCSYLIRCDDCSDAYRARKMLELMKKGRLELKISEKIGK